MTKVFLKPCPCSNCAQKSRSKFDIWPFIRNKSQGVLSMVWRLPQCLSWQKSVLWQICLKPKIQTTWQGTWKLFNSYATGHPHLLRRLQPLPQRLDSVLSSAQLLFDSSVCMFFLNQSILQLSTCTNVSKQLQQSIVKDPVLFAVSKNLMKLYISRFASAFFSSCLSISSCLVFFRVLDICAGAGSITGKKHVVTTENLEQCIWKMMLACCRHATVSPFFSTLHYCPWECFAPTTPVCQTSLTVRQTADWLNWMCQESNPNPVVSNNKIDWPDTKEITSITKEFWMDICLDSWCFFNDSPGSRTSVTLTDCHCLFVCHCQLSVSDFSGSMSGKSSHAPTSEASGISSIGGYIGCPLSDCIWACKRQKRRIMNPWLWLQAQQCLIWGSLSSRRQFQSQESQTHNESNENRRHDWSLNY